MDTFHVGSVWNLQDCFMSSSPIKGMSQNFFLGDLKSGQFRDLPIISLWGNMKMLPASHKPIETYQFFQDHPICDGQGVTDDRGSRGGHLRQNEITIPFSQISRDRMEIETSKWCQTTWPVSRFGRCVYWPIWVMIWSWHGLTWGQILKLTFQCQ